MTDREQYDLLTRESDAEYVLAGVANRAHDYPAYKLHVDRAWAFMEQAKPIFERLSKGEQNAIKADAWTGLATAFVKGLGR